MATENNVQYYYMRLKENFFSSDEMIILESMPDGYLYSNILLKLYLKSLKNKGKLVLNDFIPYSPAMLAQLTGHSVGVVEKALGIFKQLGLIEVLDNGAIFMLNIQSFIGKSSTEADRKRQYRSRIEAEKRQLLGEGQMSEQVSDKPAPETDIEKETETEKEKELEPDKELTGRERDRVELLKDLFEGWQITDYQIYYLSFLVNERLPYNPVEGATGRDLKIYDVLQRLTMQAKADNVKYIYRWLLKVIPVTDI